MQVPEPERVYSYEIKRIPNSDEYTDSTITCDGITFEVHRAVVCPQSPFFKEALQGSFKEAVGRSSCPSLVCDL